MVFAINTYSFAATVNWGLGAQSFFGTQALQGNAVGYFVYLGETTGTFGWGTIDMESFLDGTDRSMVAHGPQNSNAMGSTLAAAVNEASITKPFNDGTSVYGFIIVYPRQETTVEDMWFWQSNLLYVNSTVLSGDETYNWRTTISSGSDVKAQGWQQIPEPTTGALAFAGLALLFRRKRK